MRILFLQDDFPPQSFGGAGISTYELALGMRKAGHEVFVVTTVRKESEMGETVYEGLKVFKIASDYPDKWRAYVSLYNRPVIRQIEEILKKIKPDVVHANNIHQYLSYHSLKLAKKYARAVFFTARDTMAVTYGKLETERYLKNFDCHITWRNQLKQAGKRWNPLRNFLIRKYLGYADQVFAISKSLRESLVQNGIKDVEVIYNGIDTTDWNIDSSRVESFRTKHNLQDKKVLLFGGRLSAAKGGEKTVRALADIVKQVPETVLLVAGSVDAYAKAMQEQAKSLNIEKALIFTGWIERDEVKLAYAAADVVLMPSIYLDAFGRINIEAMASRKPVVGTCYGGTPEVTADGVTGYIVNPLYPEEIVEKVLDLLGNPEKAEKFGRAGFERAKNKFNIDEKIKQYMSYYHEVSRVV